MADHLLDFLVVFDPSLMCRLEGCFILEVGLAFVLVQFLGQIVSRVRVVFFFVGLIRGLRSWHELGLFLWGESVVELLLLVVFLVLLIEAVLLLSFLVLLLLFIMVELVTNGLHRVGLPFLDSVRVRMGLVV